MSSLLILGAGGHGKVVADAARTMQRWDTICFLDDQYPEISNNACWPVIGTIESMADYVGKYDAISVALGNNLPRLEMLIALRELGASLPAIIHADTTVSPLSRTDDGCVVFAGSVINADAEIGFGVIVNTAVSVDHDCILDSGVHLSPGVHLGGNVRIGKNTWLGIGASAINDITIGDNVIVGAGAVVTEDIPSGSKVIGIPARPFNAGK